MLSTSTLSRDLHYIVLQFLNEENFSNTARWLEQEARVFFNLKYFEEMITNGEWDKAESYLSGFTKPETNRFSIKLFFEIRKQKYLEALDAKDHAKAVDILMKDLNHFAALNEELFKEMTLLLTLENFRENAQLSNYRDTEHARSVLVAELKRLLEANPHIRDKLQFPILKESRLRMLINQSLNWQHTSCANPRPTPDIRTLLVDHECKSNEPFAQFTANQQMNSIPKTESAVPMSSNGFLGQQFHSSVPIEGPFLSWILNSSNVPRPPTPGAYAFSSLQSSDRRSPTESENNNIGVRMSPPTISERTGFPIPVQNRVALPIIDEIPRTVARTLGQGSPPTSLDFHPVQQTLLLVGTHVGDINLWEVSTREKLISKTFQVWDIGSSSMLLKASLIKDPCASVRRILWSPDGTLFGVAYSKHIVQLFTYFGGREIRQHLEIEAHIGSINDLAFCNLNNRLVFVTCGDDKTVRVFDVATGGKLFTFDGHEAPVHSICPHTKGNVNFVFSLSIDGKIKAWLYDSLGSRVDYDAPGRSCTRMIYSADGQRLFSCGTNKEGESHIVEWNENEGVLKRKYEGINKRSVGILQFDVSKKRFIAVGDDHSIKFWDMDNSNLLTAIDADGGLPATPHVRFNKEGLLLAVTTNDNKVKILATVNGVRMLHAYESHSILAAATARAASEIPPTTNGDVKMQDRNPIQVEDDDIVPSDPQTRIEIKEPAQCQSLRIPATDKAEILRLTYNNLGNGILALASNAVHMYWKWTITSNGKATSKAMPELQKSAGGIIMTNLTVDDSIADDVLSCLALSKNDSYLVSSSGGQVSLFNMVTFKTMAAFMDPPPAASALAFLPQDNNIVAVGMDDSSIHIYNVRLDMANQKLEGHTKRVTGLAFSQAQNILISSGDDAQLIVWRSENWEKQKSCFVHIPGGNVSTTPMQVQFHRDQHHLLVVNGTMLAIYETPKLKCVKQWVVPESGAPITEAKFSCNSELIFSSFTDGSLKIFDAATLQLCRQIHSTAYLPANASSPIYPVSVAAHPQDVNQFAVGLSDGSVQVFEPLDMEARWDLTVPEDGSANGRDDN